MRARCAWLQVVVAVCGWQKLAHAQLVEPLDGPAYELSNDSKALPIEVPLTLKDQAALTGAVVNRVDASDRQQPSLQHAFLATLEGSSLHLAVTFPKVHTPRSYKVWVELAGTAPRIPSGSGPAKQLLGIELLLPPAKLEAVAPFVLTHQQWPWGTCPGRGPTFQLPLHETSQQTSLSGLWIEAAHPVLNGDLQVPTRLVVQQPPTELAAGGRAHVTVQADGLEVGTTRGELVVSANELSEPVKVPFEIRTKIIDLLIIPLFWLFGALGWYVRHHLQQSSLRAELRVQIDALRKRADAEIAADPDDELLLGLKRARRALDDAASQQDDQGLQAAVAGLRTALEDLQKEHSRIVGELLSAAVQQEQALLGTYDLPAGLKLDRALDLTARARKALLDDGLREARDALAKQKNELGSLGNAIDAWSRAVLGSLKPFATDASEETSANVPSEARQDATTMLAELHELLQKAQYNQTKPPTSWADYLGGVSDANLGLRRFFDFVKGAFVAEMNAVVKATEDTERDPAPILAALDRLPPDTDDVTKTQLDELASAMRACSQAVARSLTEDEAKTLARDGKMAAAVAKEHALRHNLVAADKISDDGVSSEEAPPSSLLGREKVGRATAAAAAPASSTWERRVPALPAVVELRAIRTTSSLVSALILSVVAWYAYRDSWVGTVKDVAGIGAFAFFTDFTVNAVVEALGKLKPAS